MMSERVDAVLGSCGQMRTVIAEWFNTRPRPGRPAAGAATRPPPHPSSAAMAAGAHGEPALAPSRPAGAHGASSPGHRDVGQHRVPATTFTQCPPRDTPLQRSDESRARRAQDDANAWEERYNTPRVDVQRMDREPVAGRSRRAACRWHSGALWWRCPERSLSNLVFTESAGVGVRVGDVHGNGPGRVLSLHRSRVRFHQGRSRSGRDQDCWRGKRQRGWLLTGSRPAAWPGSSASRGGSSGPAGWWCPRCASSSWLGE